jgi:putative Mg2+ transporter-C (MgtC) family protein
MQLNLGEFLLDVSVALVLGSVIGLERQVHRHPAGLRTNALVCLGAALFVTVSRLIGDAQSPSRIASYVVSGVGFLGGGVILRDGLNVKGIDTAATLWCSAAVGVLSGMGHPVEAACGTGLVLALNLLFPFLARRIDSLTDPASKVANFQIRIVCRGKQRNAVRDDLRKLIEQNPAWRLDGMTLRLSKRRKRASIVAELDAPVREGKGVEAIAAQLGQRQGVSSVVWEQIQQAAS